VAYEIILFLERSARPHARSDTEPASSSYISATAWHNANKLEISFSEFREMFRQPPEVIDEQKMVIDQNN